MAQRNNNCRNRCPQSSGRVRGSRSFDTSKSVYRGIRSQESSPHISEKYTTFAGLRLNLDISGDMIICGSLFTTFKALYNCFRYQQAEKWAWTADGKANLWEFCLRSLRDVCLVSTMWNLSFKTKCFDPGVNFINVLHAHFSYEILAPKITKLCYGFEIFCT